MRDLLFSGFGLFTIAAAFGVIFSRNPVHSAFCLILSFFGLSGIYLLWGATFISMIQILIYTGAIVVLFVFVVMLLNLNKPTVQSFNWPIFIVAGLGSYFFSYLLLRVLSIGTTPSNGAPVAAGSLKMVSKLLFTRYLWPFEILSIFLLVLIIAIFALANPDSEGAH